MDCAVFHPSDFVLESEHMVEREAAGAVLHAVETEQAAGRVADEDVAGLAGGAQGGGGEMRGGADKGGAGAADFDTGGLDQFAGAVMEFQGG